MTKAPTYLVEWAKIEDAIYMASRIGILDHCTCDAPLIKWRTDKCGHCLLKEALVTLAEIQAHTQPVTELPMEKEP